MLWTDPKSLTVPSLAPALTNRSRIVANGPRPLSYASALVKLVADDPADA